MILSLCCPLMLSAIEPYYTDNAEKLALEGYDAVSYFNAQSPQMGNPMFQLQWSGVKWRFVNKQNMEQFQKNPQAFAPQYGGYCPHAIAWGKSAGGVPQIWTIENGKLYMLCSYDGLQSWVEEGKEIRDRADKNWHQMLGSSVHQPRSRYTERSFPQSNSSTQY